MLLKENIWQSHVTAQGMGDKQHLPYIILKNFKIAW